MTGDSALAFPREISEVAVLRQLVQGARAAGQLIGLAPTMGYLHAGHAELARVARVENDLVVMSVFVNPTQFGPREDFSRYPRNLDHDRRIAGEVGVDILFVPNVESMYPDGSDGQLIWVDAGRRGEVLEGASRPGHFRGVATVVAKLLNMVQPDRVYFGQKDGQQAEIVQRMVRDLAFPTEVQVVPTVREPDGLALSSRNVYLSPEERTQAVALYRALVALREAVDAGERRVATLEGFMRREIATVAPSARLDYASLVDVHTLQPVGDEVRRDAMASIALYLGSIRLIDNEIIQVPAARSEEGENGATDHT